MFTLTIETGNAAFEDAPLSEVARILRELATAAENSEGASAGAGKIRDANGAACGSWTYEREAL